MITGVSLTMELLFSITSRIRFPLIRNHQD